MLFFSREMEAGTGVHSQCVFARDLVIRRNEYVAGRGAISPGEKKVTYIAIGS
jgi:hypothetical protein